VTSEASGRYGASGAAGWGDGDFNYDGKFNVFDLLAIETSGTYAAGPLSIAAVPEPALGWLAAAAAAAGLVRRLTRSTRSVRAGR